MNMKQHKTYVEGYGPKIARRFRIVDDEKGFWDGENWNPDPANTLVFHNFQSAARDLKMIQLYENIEKPMTKYRASVVVEVFSDDPVDLEKLQDYLTDVTKLSLTKPFEENEEAVIQVQIHWDQLRQEHDSDSTEQT